MNEIVKSETGMQFDFDGLQVRTAVDEKGEPLFCAKDVAVCLGYQKPRNAINEHCEGAPIQGPLHTEGGIQQARFIYEPDVYALIFGSKLESAKRFRRWVFEEVLPTIRKTGIYGIEKQKLIVAERQESRLDREFKSNALKQLVSSLRDTGLYSKEILATYEVVAAEEAIGRELPMLKPVTEDNWRSPSEIATELGISAQAVGRIISKLEIRGNIEGICKAIVNKAANSSRTVTSYLYSPKAVEMIRGAIK